MSQEDGNVRYKGKKWLLTYMDTNEILDKHIITEFLREEFVIGGLVIGREVAPTTGTIHYHAVVILDNELDSRDSRVFDVNTVHPNI